MRKFFVDFPLRPVVGDQMRGNVSLIQFQPDLQCFDRLPAHLLGNIRGDQYDEQAARAAIRVDLVLHRSRMIKGRTRNTSDFGGIRRQAISREALVQLPAREFPSRVRTGYLGIAVDPSPESA